MSAVVLASLAVTGASRADEPGVHAYTVQDIDGAEVDLSIYRGKVLLVVNVASNCGFTSQYGGLQALYEELSGEGLVVLGFPANDFGGQEPGTNEEIKGFCEQKFDVTFPMFSKISVKGEGKHPLYGYLTEHAGEVSWNFNKFLVGKDGNVIERFESRVDPGDSDLRRAIADALASDGSDD